RPIQQETGRVSSQKPTATSTLVTQLALDFNRPRRPARLTAGYGAIFTRLPSCSREVCMKTGPVRQYFIDYPLASPRPVFMDASLTACAEPPSGVPAGEFSPAP